MDPFRRLAVLAALALAVACGGPPRTEQQASGPTVDEQQLDAAGARAVLDLAGTKLALAAAAYPATQSPRATKPDGTWTTVANTDLTNWTQGFFPGALWALYDETKAAQYRTWADAWTRSLELQKTNTLTHDLGFKLFDSFGPAYRITGDPYYKNVLLTAAASLATRYYAAPGIIKCCDWNPDWTRPLVVDTMMNLELLFWGAANGGPAEWRDMALHHALRTAWNAVRADGSTFHVVDYTTEGGTRWRGTYQGYADWSTWTRGQAWAIYGFTMAYRYTGDSRMLYYARKTTDYYLSRLPADLVPNWDFDAPTLSKDSSAAAVVASALFELSKLETNSVNRTRYLDYANRMLASLAGPSYLAPASTMNLLMHGVGNYPYAKEVDVGLIYGDYYFIEALRRYLAAGGITPPPPPPPPSGIVFQDDFSRTGAMGSNWTVPAGSYSCDGAAARGLATQSFAVWTGTASATDTVLIRTATPLAATTAGLLLRANAAAPTRDHYRLYVGTDKRIHFARRLNWSYTYFWDGPAFPAGSHTLSATATGSGPVVISIKLDGAEIARVTDAAPGALASTTKAGLFDMNGLGQRIDQFLVTRP